MMVRQCDGKIPRGVRRVGVIGEYVISKGSPYCHGANWTGNVWKKKGQIH